MVHALRTVHGLLKPQSMMIDIHPAYEKRAAEVHIDGDITYAGWVQRPDEFIDLRQANEALKAVIEQGLFELEKSGRFTFLTRTDNSDDWLEELTGEWSESYLDEATIQHVEDAISGPGSGKEVVIREIVDIARLRVVF